MKAAGWKSVAWGGAHFAVPPEWAPARIGPRYLLFEAEAGPAMEVKWGPCGRRFSSRSHLRRLSRQVSRNGAVLRERELPGGGASRRGELEGIGFEWQNQEQGALGALVYCPVCRTLSLLQFFLRGDPVDGERQAGRVLRSFRDHRPDDRSVWALYDIRAVLPNHFRLTGQRFEAGRFLLEFQGPRRKLTLYRWAPAGVLLKGRSLAAFAAQFAGGAGIDFLAADVAGLPGIEGLDPRPAGLGSRWRAAVTRAWYRGVRIWCVEQRNRILGVRLEGRQPITTAELAAVCSGYGMDEETEKPAELEPA